eukprot:1149687-Pelagomonas_calceolata.AAC.2
MAVLKQLPWACVEILPSLPFLAACCWGAAAASSCSGWCPICRSTFMAFARSFSTPAGMDSLLEAMVMQGGSAVRHTAAQLLGLPLAVPAKIGPQRRSCLWASQRQDFCNLRLKPKAALRGCLAGFSARLLAKAACCWRVIANTASPEATAAVLGRASPVMVLEIPMMLVCRRRRQKATQAVTPRALMKGGDHCAEVVGAEEGKCGKGAGSWSTGAAGSMWMKAGLRALHQRQMLKEEKELLHHALASGHLQQGASGSNARSAREEMEEERRQEVAPKAETSLRTKANVCKRSAITDCVRHTTFAQSCISTAHLERAG